MTRWWCLSSRELASGKLLVDEPADGVARIRISNPARRGALDHEILDAMAAEVQGQDAHCLLLTGHGPVFSAGYDIGSFDDEAFSQEAESLVAHPFTAAIEAIEAYRFPVVAGINATRSAAGSRWR